jgi:hypothetical protein
MPRTWNGQARVYRAEARLDGPGQVVVRNADGDQSLGGPAIIVAVGSNSTLPDDIDGLDQIKPWTNREATTARELPRSLVITVRARPGSRWRVGPAKVVAKLLKVFRMTARQWLEAVDRFEEGGPAALVLADEAGDPWG